MSTITAWLRGWTHTFSPTFLMDFRFGWFRYNPQTAFWDQGQTPMTGFRYPWT